MSADEFNPNILPKVEPPKKRVALSDMAVRNSDPQERLRENNILTTVDLSEIVKPAQPKSKMKPLNPAKTKTAASDNSVRLTITLSKDMADELKRRAQMENNISSRVAARLIGERLKELMDAENKRR